MTNNYLLIHGAWQGKWVWETVAARLHDAGHNVRTLDLPGSGDDRTPAGDVTLAEYAKAIVRDALILSKKGDIILVGHSMGGAAVTAAACLAPELFAKVIYLCAFLPRPNESVSELGAESKVLGTTGPKAEPNPQSGMLTLKPESIVGTFFNDVTSDNLQPLVDRFCPQPMQPLLTKLSWTPEFAALPKAYVICQRDCAIAPKLQQKMATRAGINEIYELDAGHEPFISCPKALIEVLTKLHI